MNLEENPREWNTKMKTISLFSNKGDAGKTTTFVKHTGYLIKKN